jgi:hypothetical protein
MRGFIVGWALVLVLGLVFAVRAGDEPEVMGTIELKGGSAGAGIGFSWGSGTLTYKGKHYPITAEGFDVGDVGVSEMHATGKIYNMTSLEQFDGSYTGFEAGAALVAGGAGVSMVNQNGVHIRLVSATEGVKLVLAGDTVSLKIKK